MTYTVMVGLVLINIFLFIQGRLLLKVFIAVTRINPKLFTAMIVAMAFVGTYAINRSMTDVIVLCIFGILGYFFTQFGFPLPPFVLAMVLAPLTENAMRQSLLMSIGDPSIFIRRPICLAFLLISVFSVLSSLLKPYIDKWKKAKASS